MIPNIVATAGKKITKAIVKKEAREQSDTFDELSNSTALNPLDAKPLNEGEDERLEKILKSKEKFEPYYEKQLEKLKQQQKLIQDINQNNNAEEDILYKHPSQITEAEIKNSMIYSGYKTSKIGLIFIMEQMLLNKMHLEKIYLLQQNIQYRTPQLTLQLKTNFL